jgi:hypothetical protein
MIRIVLEMEPGDLRDLLSPKPAPQPKPEAPPRDVASTPKPSPQPKVAAAPDPNSTRALIADLLRRKPMTTAQILKSLESLKSVASIQSTLVKMRQGGEVLTRQDEGVHCKTHFLPECPDGIVTGAQAIAH